MDSQKPLTWRPPLLMAAVGLSAFASGTLASMSLITVPAILTNTTNAALLTSWSHTLDYGVKVAPPFAMLATAAHFFNAYINRNSAYGNTRYSVAAAISTIGIVPYTLIILAPTNQELFKREQAARGTTTEVEAGSLELVRKWARLNLFRALLPAAGAMIACFTL